MKLEDVKSCIYGIASEFFGKATVIWAEQINTKPEVPYVTLKTNGINRTNFPIIENDGTRHYPCSTKLEINLYTKGNPISTEPKTTGNYSNTAVSDLGDFFSYLESDRIVDRLAELGIDISLELQIRDLTSLQNDSRYRYRSMAEATVSFHMLADGQYGVSGEEALPNASGGGTADMLKDMEYIENVEIGGK